MSFREAYTTDERIMKQWINSMNDKLHNEQEKGNFSPLLHIKDSGIVLVGVFNRNNFRSFRCVVPIGLERYGLARCYAKATGNKVMTLVHKVPCNVAIKENTFITRFITSVYNSEDALVKIDRAKYRKHDGVEARQFASDIEEYKIISDSNNEFFIEAVHVYDLG